MSVEVILAGLIGSIVTVIVTKVLDMIQKQKEYKYSLYKYFFERKIQAAEAAVSKWYSTASSLGSLSILYEQMSSGERELDYEIFMMMNDAFSSQLEQISKASSEISNTIFLYFDIEDTTFWDYEPFRKFLGCLSSIKSLDIPMKVALNFYDKYKETERKEFAWSEVERISKQYKPHFEELSSILDKAQREIVNLLRKVRLEMKKYDA